MPSHRPGRRLRRALFVFALVVVASLLALIVLTPPKPILRQAISASPWLLAQTSGGRQEALHHAVNGYLEFAIAGVMAERVKAHGDRDDVARIDYAIRRGQLRMLNHLELPHDTHAWPVLIAGIGYCDQINAALCQVLSHSFEHAQLYATYDPQTRTSPHTIGRVWSSQRREWLYFDAFPDRPVVFHRTAGGGIEYLNNPVVRFGNRQPPPEWTYRLDGWVLNEYTRSFAGFIAGRILSKRSNPPSAPGPLAPMPIGFAAATPGSEAAGAPPAQPAAAAAPAPPNAAVAAPAAPNAAGAAPAAPNPANALEAAARRQLIYERVARAYIAARADDLLGDRAAARREYDAIADDDEAKSEPAAALLQEAARQFAGR